MRPDQSHHIVVGDVSTNCWIYPLTDGLQGFLIPPDYQGCALIDPGAEARRIITRLNSLKMIPLYILLTHGHFDHIMALPSLAAEYCKLMLQGSRKQPIIAIHKADAQYLGPGSYLIHHKSFAAIANGHAEITKSLVEKYMDNKWKDMPPADLTLEDGDEIGPFTVLHLPGHTPGSIALWDKNAGILFSGDTLFQADYGRTDLPGGNETELFSSLKRLFAMDGQIKVYPGHGPTTTIGKEANS